MEISQIKTLIHVAELGSLSRASDRLGVAQPALSRQIRMLEDELNAPLFVRHGRGMELTEIGRELLAPAGQILTKLDEMRRLAQQGRTSLMGRVRIGMTPTVAEIMAVPLANRLKETHPRLSLCITSAYSGHLIEWLKRDEIDCCVSYDPDATGWLRTKPILLETLMLVGGPKANLALDQALPFSDLANRPLILPSPMHGLRRIVDDCAKQAGIRLTPEIEVDAFAAMIDLVRAELGLTILPLAPIYRKVRTGELCVSPIVNPTPRRRVIMTYATDRPISGATRHVGNEFSAIAALLVEQGIWAGEAIEAEVMGADQS